MTLKNNKIALINGKLVDGKNKKSDVTNILFINDQILGMGYIPDDDDSNVVDAKNSWIVQDTSVIYKLSNTKF